MKFIDFIERTFPPDPWSEAEKIPWNDAAFSKRMLQEHLLQDHNAASRRAELIDRHVDWIHNKILAGKGTKILDLGCGPGLYTSRLARRGHQTVGIDFGPASIAYALEHAKGHGLTCQYLEGDVRETVFGSDYGLVMMIHGKLNTFNPTDTKNLLKRCWQALRPGGQILVEVHTLAVVQEIGERESRWTSSQTGLFSQRPHLFLREAYWDAGKQVTTDRIYIIDGQTGEVEGYTTCIQGYKNHEYIKLFEEISFIDVVIYHSLTGEEREDESHYLVVVAKKSTSSRGRD